MINKSLITLAVVAVAVAMSAGSALARDHGGTTPRTAAAGVSWTNDQLQQLATAYKLKNPGWHSPMSSSVHPSAQLTWTTDNLDRLARAYGALNPGWTRPVATQNVTTKGRVSGGTGAYRGATGSFTFTGSTTSGSSVLTGHSTGTVSY